MAGAVSIGTVYGLFELRENITRLTPPVVRELRAVRAEMGAVAQHGGGVAKALGSFGSASSAFGKSLSLNVTAPIVGAAAGLLGLAVQAANTGDAIAKGAREAGVSAKAFQEIQFAIGQIADVDTERVTKGLARMTKTIGDAAAGSKSATSTLQQLGFSTAEIAAGTITGEQAFDRFVKAMQGAASPAAALALASDLVGDRLGPKLAGALREGGGQVDALRGQFRELGLGMSDDALAGAETFNDQLDVLTQQFGALGREIGSTVLPILTGQLIPWLQSTGIPALQSFIGVVADVAKWFANLPAPVQAAIGVVAGLAAALGPLLVVVGTVASAISAAIPIIATVGGTLAALATGPVALVVAAIAGLALVWVTWGDDITRVVSETIASVKHWLVGVFESDVVQAMVGLVRSIFGVWTEFQALVVAVVGVVIGKARELFLGVKEWLGDKLAPVFDVLRPAFQLVERGFLIMKDAVVGTAKALYEGVKTWMLDRFTGIVDGIKTKVDAVGNFFKTLKDNVVGNSYVPDMITGIGAEFGRLGAVMVSPTAQATSVVGGLFASLKDSALETFKRMLTGAQSFKDGFLAMWGEIKTKIADTLTGILQDFINRFLKGMTNALTGQGGLSQAFSGFLPGLLGGGGNATAGMILGTGGAPVIGIPGGAGTAGGSGMAGTVGSIAGGAAVGGLVGWGVGSQTGNAWGGGAAGAASGAAAGAALGAAFAPATLGLSAAVGALVGVLAGWAGAQKARKAANNDRDAFIGQWGGQGTGAGSGFMNLQAELTAATGQVQGAGSLFETLIKANDPKEFAQRMQEVVAVIEDYRAKTVLAAGAEKDLADKVAATRTEFLAQSDAIRAQMGTLDTELARLNASEAPEEFMGTVEKNTRARIASQKGMLTAQLDTIQQQQAAALLALETTSGDAARGIGDGFGLAFDGVVEDARITRGKFDEIFGGLRYSVDVTGKVDWDLPEAPDRIYAGPTRSAPGPSDPSASYAEGAYIRRDHVARVHAGELIGPVSFMSDALAGAMAKNGGSRGVDANTRPSQVTFNINAVDAKSFEDMLRDPDKAEALTFAMANHVANGGKAMDRFARAVRYTNSIARR